MTAHKRKEWYIVAKNKRLTNKEKQARAELKKRMQDKGVLPLDKPKLNRKKFIDEARKEWNGRSSDCFIWEHYLMDAISYMLCQREGMSSRASLEAVGAAKVLKLAIRLREFSEEVREKGEHEYKLVDQYNYIKDILDPKVQHPSIQSFRMTRLTRRVQHSILNGSIITNRSSWTSQVRSSSL